MQSLFEFDTGKLDFISITPWQTCRLIAKVAVPSQRRFQWQASLLEERDHVIGVPRLFRNASSQEPKQNPAKNGRDACKKNALDSYKNHSDQNEKAYDNKRKWKKNVRRSISPNHGVQAECDAAGKCCGDRYSRQPHGSLRNL